MEHIGNGETEKQVNGTHPDCTNKVHVYVRVYRSTGEKASYLLRTDSTTVCTDTISRLHS
jgi:hypothetical protein